jgi:bifunctional non-homologous end joining protein LigD
MPASSVVRASDLRRASDLPQIDPVVLASRADPFDDSEWLFEPKYDGFRGMLYASNLGCEIRSPRDDRIDRFVSLWDRVAEVLRGREAILDGEIVSLDRHGKPVLQDLIRGQGYLAFAAFDLLWLEGRDLRSSPLARRKALLAELLPEDTGPLYKVLTIEEHGRALYSAVRRMELAGIVAKRLTDPYDASTVWYRISNPDYTQPAVQSEVLHSAPRTPRVGRNAETG